MRTRLVRATITSGLLSLILTACASVPAPVIQTRVTEKPSLFPNAPTVSATHILLTNTPTATVTETLALMSSTPPATTTEQIDLVTTFMEFMSAYNAGQLDEALGLMDDKVVGSDCDFKGVRVITFDDKSGAREWLNQRIKDHDQLRVNYVLMGNQVIGVDWAHRTNDTLTRLGFVQGIQPHSSAKVVFSRNPTRISTFANATPIYNGGNPAEECSP